MNRYIKIRLIAFSAVSVLPRSVALVLVLSVCLSGLVVYGLDGAASEGAAGPAAKAAALKPGEARLQARDTLMNALRAGGQLRKSAQAGAR